MVRVDSLGGLEAPEGVQASVVLCQIGDILDLDVTQALADKPRDRPRGGRLHTNNVSVCERFAGSALGSETNDVLSSG